METKQLKDGKQYKILYPQFLGLKTNKEYIFVEKLNGYSCEVGKYMWIGYPKPIVENNPELFVKVEKYPLK